MKKKFYKSRFDRKHYAIKQHELWYERGIMWNDVFKKARVGTKREMEILLNGKLYQDFNRGARVVDVKGLIKNEKSVH